jgi:carotenoid cleavage dioxygenase
MAKVLARHVFDVDLKTPPKGSWGEKYRTGVWRPVHEEIVAEELEVIQGAIPKDFSGTYIRNTENPIQDSMDGNENYHPFDGDAMLHSIRFEGGKTHYSNKFVRTKAFEEEQAAGRSLWAGLLEYRVSKMRSERPGWGEAGGKMYKLKDTASTDVVVHAGRIIPSWYMCGEAYSLNLRTLETEGINEWTPNEGVSAHTKVDENTGELLFFNYGIEGPRTAPTPFINYGVVDVHNQLTHYQHIPFLPDPKSGVNFPHDMAFTKRYSIVNHFSGKAHFAIIPRNGGDPQWFEGSKTYVLHFLNAFEETDHAGHEWIVLDGYHMAHPEVFTRYDNLDLTACKPQLWRWKFNLSTGQTHEECLDPTRCLEFGMINQRYAGEPYRYTYRYSGILSLRYSDSHAHF